MTFEEAQKAVLDYRKKIEYHNKKYYEEDCHSKLFDDVLCDVMKEYGIDFEIIEKELNVSSKESIELSVKICNQFEKMLENELKNFSFEEIFDFYRNADLIYTNEQVVSTTNFDEKPLINIEVGSIKNINELFYEGFGKDIYCFIK